MKEKLQIKILSNPVVFVTAIGAILILIFASMIFVFELRGLKLSFIDAMFTAVSAYTLTGLGLFDTHTLSTPSQIVALLAIQTGALITFVWAYIILKVAGYRGRGAAELISQVSWSDIKTIIIFTFLVESLAALAFFFSFRNSMPTYTAVYFSVFHAVSAYCNAGFYLFTDNFYSFSSNVWVMSIAMAEVILGAVGFVVIVDMKLKALAFLKRENAPLFRVETRLVIIGTIVLLLIGFLGFWFFEADGVLAGKPNSEAALVSMFESVNSRNSGLSAIDLSGIENHTSYLYMVLMYIGAGSGSVSGGVKITTLAVVFLTFIALFRGRRQVIVWGSEISYDNIWRAMGVLVIFGFITFFMTGLLLAFESFEFKKLLFESISASGTVGLSMGITPELSLSGKIIVMVTMLFGRLGPLTLTYLLAGAIMGEMEKNVYKEEVSVG